MLTDWGTARPLHDDAEMLSRTVLPYVGKGAVYLREAAVSQDRGRVTCAGVLSVDESCCLSADHNSRTLDAAEFLISSNQMIYFTLAVAVRDGLVPALADWCIDDFWERQLPSVLIRRAEAEFATPVNATRYRGLLSVDDVTLYPRLRPMILIKTSVEFEDDAAGRARGQVEVVLTDLPGR